MPPKGNKAHTDSETDMDTASMFNQILAGLKSINSRIEAVEKSVEDLRDQGSKLRETERELKIGFWSANGMGTQRKVDEINRLIVDNDFDVLVIVETRLTEAALNKLRIHVDGYKYENFPSGNGVPNENRVRGGISIYLRDTITYAVQREKCYENPATLAQFAEISITQPVQLDLVAVYNPHNRHIEELYNLLKLHLDTMQPQTQNVMVMGDFNIDLNPEKASINSEDQTILKDTYKLEQLIVTASRTSLSLPNHIDHIYYSGESRLPVVTTGVILTDISDHYPTYCKLKITN